MPPIDLPAPREWGRLSFEEVVMNRNSVRTLGESALSLHELGQLLWAAYGHGKYGRTVPSAGACYPLVIYAVAESVENLEPGVYRYRSHQIEQIGGRVGGLYDYHAPAYLLLTVDNNNKIFTRYGRNRGERYAQMEVGHVAQNVVLQALALDLCTVVVGGFLGRRLQALLHISEYPICLIPVGRAA